jgi:predicted NBD/HSP70 family sugar kinase
MADLVIGIDIGGTKIAAGLLDLQGNILARGSSRSHSGCPPGYLVESVI